jgi:hypothetical protein
MQTTGYIQFPTQSCIIAGLISNSWRFAPACASASQNSHVIPTLVHRKFNGCLLAGVSSPTPSPSWVTCVHDADNWIHTVSHSILYYCWAHQQHPKVCSCLYLYLPHKSGFVTFSCHANLIFWMCFLHEAHFKDYKVCPPSGSRKHLQTAQVLICMSVKA